MPLERQMKMSEFLDIMDSPEKYNGVFYIQKQNSNLTDEFSAIISDVDKDIPLGTEAFGEFKNVKKKKNVKSSLVSKLILTTSVIWQFFDSTVDINPVGN